MAVTASSVRSAHVPGDETLTITDVTFDSSYPTGGEVVTPAQLGHSRVTAGWTELKNGSENESEFPIAGAFFDVANLKIKLNSAKSSKEVANGKNVEKVVVRVYALGH